MKAIIPEGGITVHKELCESDLTDSSHRLEIFNSALTIHQKFDGCIRDFLKKSGFNNVCVAIGTFDGVHLGHQQVIKKMIADAKIYSAAAVVVTFDRHPKSVIPHSKPPLMIYPLKQKLKMIELLDVGFTALIPFDVNLSKLEATCFVKILRYELGKIKSISVGKNFLFGHNRAGNLSLLEKMGKQLGFDVHGLSAVSLDGKIISSTKVREAISIGNIELASQMLGREYSILGSVVRGDNIGSKIGFPTANVDVGGLVLPPNGVYAAHIVVKKAMYNAVLNIGVRPTIKQSVPQKRCEAHLLDFNSDIYGEEVEVIIQKKIRDEVKFKSLQALKRQIQKDIQEARKIFKN